MRGRDIVVIGIQPWDISIGSNCKNIAIEFSKHNRVLYVNEPLNRISSIRESREEWVKKRKRIINNKESHLENVKKNFWAFYPQKLVESINWIPDGPIYDKLNYRNNKLFYSEINRAIHALGFKDIILFNDSLISLGFYSTEFLRPSISIYYIRDNLTSQPYFAKHGLRLEPKLAGKYDAVVANSDYLANYLKKHNKYSYMVGQGCDLALFDMEKKRKCPEDLKMEGPIVGYVGYLTSIRLDIELLEYFARECPNLNLVLVGPEDKDFESSELHNYPNVYFLGNKKGESLPDYIGHFDVCINPQIVNEMTVGNYPRKIDEYLAMGKPTVATYTDTMEYFKDFVYLSHTKVEFVNYINKALQEDNSSDKIERSEFAKSHSWENNVNNIYEVMHDITRKSEATAKSSSLF